MTSRTILKQWVKGLLSVARRLGSIRVRAYLHLCGVEYGANLNCSSLPFVRIGDGGIVRMGSDVSICNTLAENPAGVTHRTALIAGSNARLTIGNGVGMCGAVVFCTAEVTIEDRVLLGAGARVYDSDVHSVAAGDRRKGLRQASAPVLICEDVWVGTSAVVLKGVTIGARSVVAAMAVVTSDVPPDTLVAGVPARAIRSR